MKKIYLILIAVLLSVTSAVAGNPTTIKPRNKSLAKKADVLKVVPHLAASDDWKSVLILRNDLDRSIDLYIDFYGFDGQAASAVFYDANEVMYERDFHQVTLAPFELQTVEFDRMTDTGLFNLQAYIFSDEADVEYSVELIFSNFQGENKVASVGGGIQTPGDNFFMNADERTDPYTDNKKIRGLAVTNIETEVCNCDAILWNNAGVQMASASHQIQPNEKLIGTVSSFFGNMALDGLYLVDFDCDRQVSAIGLSFESGTPIVGSTPIDYYVFENGKKKRR